LVVAFLLCTAAAQQGTELLDEVTRALDLVATSDYRFSYDIYPSVDAASRISGAGEHDYDSGNWRYTVAVDPTDANADQSRAGEWVIADGMGYQRSADGWTMALDFTFMGIGTAGTPFALYGGLEMLADPEAGNLEPLALVARETVDGVEADRYSFATTDMPLVGTGRFDIWLSPAGDGFRRVIVQVTKGERVDRVVYYDIGQDVTVEAPR
jgi:hypothetical protein